MYVQIGEESSVSVSFISFRKYDGFIEVLIGELLWNFGVVLWI